jgi:hypothetical protein
MAPVLTTVRHITDTGLFMDTDRIGAIDITMGTTVVDTTVDATTAEAIMAAATTEVVTMATVPTIIGTTDSGLTEERI